MVVANSCWVFISVLYRRGCNTTLNQYCIFRQPVYNRSNSRNGTRSNTGACRARKCVTLSTVNSVHGLCIISLSRAIQNPKHVAVAALYISQSVTQIQKQDFSTAMRSHFIQTVGTKRVKEYTKHLAKFSNLISMIPFGVMHFLPNYHWLYIIVVKWLHKSRIAAPSVKWNPTMPHTAPFCNRNVLTL